MTYVQMRTSLGQCFQIKALKLLQNVAAPSVLSQGKIQV